MKHSNYVQIKQQIMDGTALPADVDAFMEVVDDMESLLDDADSDGAFMMNGWQNIIFDK